LQRRDPELAPPPPDGFPPEMMTYHKFAKAYGWPPEVVRSLRRDELFWLPVIDDAVADVAEALAEK
jgi:hypothetical protein